MDFRAFIFKMKFGSLAWNGIHEICLVPVFSCLV